MSIKIAKFGGTSLATAQQFRKVAEILLSDNERIIVVPSAPGKRFDGDIKVTDMLIECYGMAITGDDFKKKIDDITQRFNDIKNELGIKVDIDSEMKTISEDMRNGASEAYVKSRGEFLSGKMLSALLGWKFVDPATVIVFKNSTTLDSVATYQNIKSECKDQKTVLPGYFGADGDGEIVTFSRGGSDITGALAAAAMDADVYENWTDVSGFYMADPRIVENVRHIEELSYEELRELSYMGAGVLHENAIFPVREKGIPINIKNTNKPQDEGTYIVPFSKLKKHELSITGVAGKRDFSIINIKKTSMNSELGFARRILSVLENHKISLEHMPTGIDTLSVVISNEFLKDKEDDVIRDIKKAINPDMIEIIPDLTLIATCGHGMVHHLGTAAKLFAALYENDINVRMIDQGSSELNIIVGIENDDYEKAVKAIYHQFVQ
ncbi:MAG: aspartate kinase [Clostridiales bacterium]|nr:aspartate kinase [Clostridiales bacterium]